MALPTFPQGSPYYRRVGNYFNLGINESLFNRLNIGVEHQARLDGYNAYWEFYMGNHFSGNNTDDETLQSINFSRMFVDKIINSMTREFFKINLPEEFNELEKDLLDVWRDNEGESLILEILQMGSVLGDVFVEVGWDEVEERPKISIIPSFMIFPKVNQLDYRKWDYVDVKFVIEIEPPARTSSIRENLQYKTIVKRYYEDRIETYEDSELTPVSVEQHDLGQIPIIHIKNYPLAAYPYGISDLADLISLNREYNVKFADISDIIDYHASPVTVVFGARVDTLEKGPNRVWGGLPIDAKVETIKLEDDLAASGDHLDRIKTAMHEISGVPRFIMGGEEAHISNTSGVAMSIVYGPLIEKVRVKSITYAKGVRDINFLLLRVLKLKDKSIKVPKVPEELKKRDMKIKFAEPQPRDVNIILEQLLLKFQLGLTTDRMALEELGTENIEDVMRQLEEYNAKKQEEAMNDFMTQSTHEANLDLQNKSSLQKQKDGKISGGGLPSGRRDVTGNNYSIRTEHRGK